MKIAAAALLLLAVGVAAPTIAHADDVPTVDQVMAILTELTDPNIPAANKTDIVTPGFSPDEAGTIDDHLTRMKVFGGLLPPLFHVTDIEPAPDNFAGATVFTGGYYRQVTNPHPIVLVNQGGHWLITHDTAVPELDVIWRASQKFHG